MASPALPGPGQVYYSRDADIPSSTYWGNTIYLEGRPKTFDDTDPDDASKMRSGRRRHCILVRNTSGVTVYPGMLMTWAAGYYGRRVDGYSQVAAAEVAGMVDDRLPVTLGARANDLFWLQVRGPAMGINGKTADEGNVYSETDWLYALTSANSTAATTGVDDAGKLSDGGKAAAAAMSVATTGVATDGTLSDLIKNAHAFARAMSASTTNETCAAATGRKLVDLKISN